MFSEILAAAQSIAEQFMVTPVQIRNRLPPDKDDENPFGDDTIEWEATATVTANGWFVNPATKSLDTVGGMSAVVSEPTLRLPVGTSINRGAEVTINGRTYAVIDVSSDETYPAMLKASLARIE